MPSRRNRILNLGLARDTRPRPGPADLPAHWPDHTPEPVIRRTLRPRSPHIDDRPPKPWTNIVRAPADDLD